MKREFDIYSSQFLYENFDTASKIAQSCAEEIRDHYDLPIDETNENQLNITHELLNVIVNLIIEASKANK